MKKLLLITTGLVLSALPPVAMAAQQDAAQQLAQERRDWDRDDRGRNDRDRNGRDRDRDWDRNDRDRDEWRRWNRGDRVPERWRGRDRRISDYRRYNLRPPPRGHAWMRYDDRFVLVANRNGMIAEIVLVGGGAGPGPRPDRDAAWRARYQRSYSLNDDSFYRECRDKPDPAGMMIGAAIGGLLGNAAAGRNNRTAPTVAGVIAGGALGAALTNKVECEDRSYMYKTYSDGFNSGRPGSRHTWSNPRNNHRGEMEVIDYYEDEDNFRCAVYSNTVYVGGRREEARGRACQQPDGSWYIID